MISKEILITTIEKFNKYSILVVGDIILDEYIWGKTSRLSPEAPVPILESDKHSYVLGGAANVANNIAALGGRSILLGITGNDPHSDILIDTVEKSKISECIIVKDINRPTTVKTRLITHNRQQLARVDREHRNPIDGYLEVQVLDRIKQVINEIDLVILSDYAKGLLTPNLTQQIIHLAKSNEIPVLIDPKGLDYSKYSNATLITPNRLEAESATKSPSGTSPKLLAQLLYEQTKIKHILVTLGEDGVFLYSDNLIDTVPAITSEVYDVTGAGDSLLSAISLGILASDGDIRVAILLGNYSAGVAVRKIGTSIIMPDELMNIIEHNYLDKIPDNKGVC